MQTNDLHRRLDAREYYYCYYTGRCTSFNAVSAHRQLSTVRNVKNADIKECNLILEQLLDHRGGEKCLRHASKSIFDLLWPWPLTHWPQNWPFHVLARPVASKSVHVHSFSKHGVVTDGRTDGNLRTHTSLAWRAIQQVTLCKYDGWLVTFSSRTDNESFACFGSRGFCMRHDPRDPWPRDPVQWTFRSFTFSLRTFVINLLQNVNTVGNLFTSCHCDETPSFLSK